MHSLLHYAIARVFRGHPLQMISKKDIQAGFRCCPIEEVSPVLKGVGPAFLDTVFCLVIKWGILVKPVFLCSNVSVSPCLNLFRAYG